jgi:hypothetical protein
MPFASGLNVVFVSEVLFISAIMLLWLCPFLGHRLLLACLAFFGVTLPYQKVAAYDPLSVVLCETLKVIC